MNLDEGSEKCAEEMRKVRDRSGPEIKKIPCCYFSNCSAKRKRARKSLDCTSMLPSYHLSITSASTAFQAQIPSCIEMM